MTKDFLKVLDRNGREIKEGDRVRLIAEECNAFMHSWHGEDWIPEMHFDKDYYGTATKNKYFELLTDDGEMIYDLEICSTGKNAELEIVD